MTMSRPQMNQAGIVLVAICNDTLQDLAWTQSIPTKGSLLLLHSLNDLTRRVLRQIEQSPELVDSTRFFAIKDLAVIANNLESPALSQLTERLKSLPEDRSRQINCLSLCFALGLDCKDTYPEAVVIVDVTPALPTGDDTHTQPSSLEFAEP